MESLSQTEAVTFLQNRRSGSVSTQLMMFLIFVVFPASWMFIAPISRIRLERNKQSITAESQRYLYFVVPYYTQKLTDITSVSVETSKGVKQGFNAHLSENENRLSQRGYSEDSSELVLTNDKGNKVRTPIDSAIIDNTQDSVKGFLANAELNEYSVSIPANRVLYWLSFPIALLTAIYVLIQALAITRLILRNPYWPFSIELANQLNEMARDQRDRLKRA